MLARAIASLDHMLQGRLTINIISSDMPGTKLDSPQRYQRSREVIQILKQAWTQDRIEFQGDFYEFDLPTEAVKPYQQNGGPLLYFGGISDDARALCAECCDVFLMWPETEDRLAETMRDMSKRAAGYGRSIDFGLRIHMIVRETEAEARKAAQRLVSRLDDDVGRQIKHRSQDASSAGVLRQDALRDSADEEGFIEPLVWSGIGRARSGCGSAIVGDPDQVCAKLQRYIDMGMRAFIFSGYPHKDECELFAKHVLPRLKTCCLARQQRRLVPHPVTPLTTAPRF
jgi:alkanesulfonate monooxygenase